MLQSGGLAWSDPSVHGITFVAEIDNRVRAESRRIRCLPTNRYSMSAGSLGSRSSTSGGIVASGFLSGYGIRILHRERPRASADPSFPSAAPSCPDPWFPDESSARKSAEISGVNMSPCLAPARAAPMRSTERLLRFLDLGRVVGLLQRRRRVVGLLAHLDVLVDARLEVREHLRIGVDRRPLSCARTPPDAATCKQENC